jgi:asparagine synthase (glutamine-hydrolysing)
MCGIAGVFDSGFRETVRESLIISMANAIAHRGPDELSCFVQDNVGLGIRRLSIVDVLHGHQPFFNSDRSVVLVCNGEIYNYRELRRELEARGYAFTSNCDVEVLVPLYLEYGANFLERLNGQFAFAIFDKRNNSIFLARDQFGICPLFYSFLDGQLIFGSEIKAILEHPMVKREVNPEGLDQVFTFPGLVSPVTMFKNISALAPGHYMIVTQGGIAIHQYWDLVYPEEAELPAKPESYYIYKLEELLFKSVKYRLNADVPIGFYLSGGLDSSLIGAFMKAATPEIEYPSFSIGFPWDKEMNEGIYQQQVVNHLKLKSTQIVFNSAEVENNLTQAVWSSECPLKESYNTCSLALSEAVRNQGVKVILSGEGADEFFGGYVGYRFDKQRIHNNTVYDLAQELENECRTRLWGDAGFFYEKDYYEFTELKRSLYSNGLRESFKKFDALENLVFNKERIRNRHVLHKRSYVDLKLRLSDHLIADHCDRATYANSVEGRFPFLDIELIEFVKTIPPDLKVNGLIEKYILKKLAVKYVPDSIINRQKFGFIAPGSPWLLQSNSEFINDMLSYDRIKRQGYFDPDIIERLKKKYSTKGFTLNLPFESDLLIVVLTFSIFLDLYKMPDYT